jgi:hypothetical protein
MPSWVTDFAEPILQAIEGRTPYFADDFSTENSVWRLDSGGQLAWTDGGLRAEPLDDQMWVTLLGASFADYVHSFTLTVIDGGGRIELHWGTPNGQWEWQLTLHQWGARDWTWDLGFCRGGTCDGITNGEVTSLEDDRLDVLFLERGGTIALYLDGIPQVSHYREIPQDVLFRFKFEVDRGRVWLLDDVRMWELTGMPGLP